MPRSRGPGSSSYRHGYASRARGTGIPSFTLRAGFTAVVLLAPALALAGCVSVNWDTARNLVPHDCPEDARDDPFRTLRADPANASAPFLEVTVVEEVHHRNRDTLDLCLALALNDVTHTFVLTSGGGLFDSARVFQGNVTASTLDVHLERKPWGPAGAKEVPLEATNHVVVKLWEDHVTVDRHDERPVLEG